MEKKEVIQLDDKPNYFAIIPASVRYDSRLKPIERLLYGEITALTNKYGYCYANNGYFAKLYECATETISRYIADLAKCGHISVIVENGYQRKIFLTDSQLSRGVDSSVKGVCQNCQGGMTELSRGVDRTIKHNNTLNKKLNNTVNIDIPDRPQKHKYGQYENVLLSDDELLKLQAEFPDWRDRIERVSEYCASKGKTYKNFLATIRAWARKDNKQIRKNDAQAGLARALELMGISEDDDEG